MIDALFRIKRANGKAPHKAILLLALIQQISEGEIKENRIFITPELIASFKEIWSRLVEGHWDCKFFLPFYHQNLSPESLSILKTPIPVKTYFNDKVKAG